jgi:hypothetical protein
MVLLSDSHFYYAFFATESKRWLEIILFPVPVNSNGENGCGPLGRWFFGASTNRVGRDRSSGYVAKDRSDGSLLSLLM